MVSGQVLASVALQAGTALVAAYGAWRCVDLQRVARDRRLKALGWFFGLFAVSVLLHAVWTWQIGSLLDGVTRSGGNFTRGPRPEDGDAFRRFFRPVGTERVTVWLIGHHVFMLASLVVGVFAFGRRRSNTNGSPAAAALPLAFFGNLIPLALALQAGLTLYLAAKALLNHMDRRSPGALQVAMGFSLFFLGHLLFFLQHRPGLTRTGIGDVLTLVGVTLLVQVLPGKQ